MDVIEEFLAWFGIAVLLSLLGVPHFIILLLCIGIGIFRLVNSFGAEEET